jgi:uncharacterized protein (DUF433 family)
MQRFDRITWNPQQMNGQPCIRGMRLTVRRVVEAVAIYPDRADLFRNYPELEPDDVQQALAFAAANLEDSAAETSAAWSIRIVMRLILDQGVPRDASSLLRKLGYECTHVGEAGMSRAADQEILAWAAGEKTTAVTLDADFHAILAVSGATGLP